MVGRVELPWYADDCPCVFVKASACGTVDSGPLWLEWRSRATRSASIIVDYPKRLTQQRCCGSIRHFSRVVGNDMVMGRVDLQGQWLDDSRRLSSPWNAQVRNQANFGLLSLSQSHYAPPLQRTTHCSHSKQWLHSQATINLLSADETPACRRSCLERQMFRDHACSRNLRSCSG